jgi:flagellar hook-basal body complex protein FliE
MLPIGIVRQVQVPELKITPNTEIGGATQIKPARQLPDGVQQIQPGAAPETSGIGNSFGDFLNKAVSDINQKQNAANQAVSELIAGNNVPLHQVIIAMEEASISFQLMVEVRNKLLESYQEFMRMQV